MSYIRLAVELFIIYVFYKLIFDFIIPVYQSTKKIKKQFGDIQSKMQSDMNAYQNKQTPPQPEPKQQIDGDYIDYEEVKS